VYALLLALLSAVLFGASTPASKLLLRELEPLQLTGLLYLGAAAGVAPVVWLERRRGLRATAGRANAARLAGAVLLGGLLGPVLMLVGLRQSEAGSVSLLLNLESVATALLGVAFFREPLGRLGWVGVAGVVGAGGILAASAGWPGFVAALLVAAACLCWGLDNHWTALIDGITPAASTLAKGLGAGATALALGIAAAPFAAGATVVTAALATGALCYGASIALYIAAAQELGATRAQGVFASAPFVGAGLSFGLLGERFGWEHAVAAPLLALSLMALLRSRHVHPHLHEPTEHVHSHSHDDGHHLHAHEGLPRSARHTHAHRHERLEHAHPHWPDVHHRHGHPRGDAHES
jgi:drug/metabolite transporter (DMT)-like permease